MELLCLHKNFIFAQDVDVILDLGFNVLGSTNAPIGILLCELKFSLYSVRFASSLCFASEYTFRI